MLCCYGASCCALARFDVPEVNPNHSMHALSAALGELRQGLQDALVLELEPGEQFWQESSVVLLRGKLLCSGQAASVPMQQLPGTALLHGAAYQGHL